jgi:Membrane domain of glycerophosphoryl diester phosphodiesterase
MVADVERRESFDFGRVIGGTFGLIGRNFLPFLLLAALLAGLPYFGILVLQSALAATDPGAMVLASFGASIGSLLAAMILQGALTRASIDDLSGKGVSIGPALSSGLRYFFPLLGLGIFLGLGIMLGLILLIVPGIILAIRWMVSSPPIVVEDVGITEAMGRSATLTKGHRWALFGLCLLYLILVYAVTIVATLLTGSFETATMGVGIYSTAALIILPVVQTLLSLVGTVGVASTYFELRRIKEGVNVADLASVFD